VRVRVPSGPGAVRVPLCSGSGLRRPSVPERAKAPLSAGSG